MENDDILLAMPYASQGSVYHLLRTTQRPFTEDFAVSCIIKPFLSGLEYLHSMDIIHRDIKTENVVVDEQSQVMIVDFGLAIHTHTTSAHLRVGTPLYMVRLCPQDFSNFSLLELPERIMWTQFCHPVHCVVGARGVQCT